MIIPSKYRPELGVSKDRPRELLTSLYLRGSMLYATNGRMAIQIPVEREPDDVDGFIPVEALVEARQTCARSATTRRQRPGSFMMSARKATLAFDSKFGPIEMKRPEPGVYPTMTGVIDATPRRRTHCISFDVAFLSACAAALGHKCVTISFDGPETPIIVQALDNTGAAHAVLMPVRPA